MKIGTIILIALVLTVLFGAVPLQVLGSVFNYIGDFLKTIGNSLDFFGWGGVLAAISWNSVLLIRGNLWDY